MKQLSILFRGTLGFPFPVSGAFALCLLLTAGLLASLAACAGQTDPAVVKDLYGDLQKVSYSSTYTSQKDNKTNKTNS